MHVDHAFNECAQNVFWQIVPAECFMYHNEKLYYGILHFYIACKFEAQ